MNHPLKPLPTLGFHDNWASSCSRTTSLLYEKLRVPYSPRQWWETFWINCARSQIHQSTARVYNMRRLSPGCRCVRPGDLWILPVVKRKPNGEKIYGVCMSKLHKWNDQITNIGYHHDGLNICLLHQSSCFPVNAILKVWRHIICAST